jgi:hypothetical protein
MFSSKLGNDAHVVSKIWIPLQSKESKAHLRRFLEGAAGNPNFN